MTPSAPTGPAVPAARDGFRPAFGFGNPHVQTIAGKFLRPKHALAIRRERVRTPDGDFLDLDFAADEVGSDEGTKGPVVAVLHGLEGSTRRRYMTNTFRALVAAGLRPVGVNFRGCSGEPNLTPRAYHSGETEDLAFVLSLLRDRFGGPIGLAGYSLGGNVTLKFLGERGDRAAEWVSAAVAVSVPFDLEAGARKIGQGVMGRIYTRYFMRSLHAKVRAKAELLRPVCDPEAVLRSRTLREFDDVMTAPIHGFADALDYYRRSSSLDFIARIRVPTLVIHSLDDPFLPAERIPVRELEANPAIELVLTERGGHVGFLAGSALRPDFWVERTVAAFLAERLRG